MRRFLGMSIRNQTIPVRGLESFFMLGTCLADNRFKSGRDLLAKFIPFDIGGSGQSPEHEVETVGIRRYLRGQCPHPSLNEVAVHGIANGLGNDETKTVITLGFVSTNPCI